MKKIDLLFYIVEITNYKLSGAETQFPKPALLNAVALSKQVETTPSSPQDVWC